MAQPYRTTSPSPEESQEPAESARLAGLRYVSDQEPGIRRERSGERFRYRDADGSLVGDGETLARIQSLAIPPAWEDVWICASANGHLQATGRDARGRKQYRYHPEWRHVRDDTKYARMIAFGEALPRIREQTDVDLALRGLPRKKVLAAVVRLLEITLIRVGNEEYARDNRSFGLTTMRDRHVGIDGSQVEFRFKGKSGKKHLITLRDRRLARVVQKCRDIPGQELFQYVDDEGTRQSIDSADVNSYLRELSGHDFTAKDFRTWAGTVLATLALEEFAPADSRTQARRNLVRAVESVAQRLGNTPTVCRKCYIHPAVLDAYLEGTMLDSLQRKTDEALAEAGLPEDEAMVLDFLRRRLEQEEQNDRARTPGTSHRRGRKPARARAGR